ncbi:2484_t:CDS:1, partial [Ambispora leptoticha]
MIRRHIESSFTLTLLCRNFSKKQRTKHQMHYSNGSDILRPAATIIIAAPINKIDGVIEYNDEFNYKVLTMKRNDKGSFVNAHVFPGGNVDSSDSSREWSNLISGHEFTKIIDHEQSSSTSSLTSKICAIRETFEECGILLTKPNFKFDLTDHDEAKQWRDKIHNDASEFISLCKKFKLKPAIEELYLIYNWITPSTNPKRYNVNFYLTILPDDISYTDIVADGKEAIQLNWFTPEEALTAFRKSEIDLFPPQWYTFTELFKYK